MQHFIILNLKELFLTAKACYLGWVFKSDYILKGRRINNDAAESKAENLIADLFFSVQ